MELSLQEFQLTGVGNEVYDDLTYCFQEWASATAEAVNQLPALPDEGSNYDWVVSFIGNMAWAAVVFFPPAAGTVAAASTATKAVSLLGAAVGSGLMSKFDTVNLILSEGRAQATPTALKRHMLQQVPTLLEVYKSEANIYIRSDLFGLAKSEVAKLRSSTGQPDALVKAIFFKGIEWASMRRQWVWESYVFRSKETPYYNTAFANGGRLGLQDYIYDRLKAAWDQFNKLYAQYSDRRSQATLEYLASLRRNLPWSESGAEYAEEWMERNPFTETFIYPWLPMQLPMEMSAVQNRNYLALVAFSRMKPLQRSITKAYNRSL